ncbi:hypothetical protein [Paenibacillus hexagrammi]|uniref:Uncharacterized protein n=1 Tax=Paenibacillus hexagrammi TaxID=2908839 RepID=A0ABY3SRA8_9BACL|nr:hypothetical protein [Paenibacillus sp. YPD9-1]UJF36592.1 hypothetical protein L0M14_30350 [Paenibacillus sp. YPD9-1]
MSNYVLIGVIILGAFLLFIVVAVPYFKLESSREKMVTQPSDHTVRLFIDKLNTSIIFYQSKPTNWDTLRANFELIADSDSVSHGVKIELRNALLQKGVSRLKEVRRK